MIDAGLTYERCRQALVGDLQGCSADELATPVPATPAWRVHDVLAHVVGLATALNAQHLPAPDDEGGTAWAAAQVAERAERTVADLVAEWDGEAPAFEDGLRLFGIETGRHFVADLAIHLADVRQALGRPAALDPEAMVLAVDHYVAFLDEQLRADRWGVLEVVAGDRTHRAGGDDGPVRARLEAPPFDVLRAIAARRSAAQLRAMAWSGDVDAALDRLAEIYRGGYALPASDLPPEAP